MGEDMKMTDFPTYPWETLDVYQDNSYCYNIRPGQHVVGDLFDDSRTKLVSYNRKSHAQIICVSTPTSRLSMRVNVCMVYIRRGKKSERTSLTWS